MIEQLLTISDRTYFDKDAIVIATDNDPSGEGDVLGWEIVNALDWKGKVYRIRFADETPKGIIKSLNNWEDATEQFKQPIYLAGLARQRFDYLQCSIQEWPYILQDKLIIHQLLYD